MTRPLSVLLFVPIVLQLYAQDPLPASTRYGFYAGLNLAYGTHVQRLGINLGVYLYKNQLQSNSEIRLYRNRKTLGPTKAHNELILSQGLVYGYGELSRSETPFMSSTSNQTGYNYSFAYTYNAYFNKVSTTQQTGILALQFNDVFILSENDLLARPTLDRFRTGAFLLMVQYQNLYQFGLNCTMWTGQMGNRQNLNTAGAFAHCYMDSSNGRYTSLSHGLLSLQFKAALPYSQNVQLNAGLDAEQIRNAVQNKLFHDLVFLPKDWRPKNNCHIPMIDNQGGLFLYREGQQIRPVRFYLNVYANPSCFY